MALRNFVIDPQYLTDVQITHTRDLIKDRNNPTSEEVILVLRGHDLVHSIYTVDHPQFTKLRNQLAAEGYIKIENGWWNGDIVLKSFKLNGWIIRKQGKFPCAVALGNSIRSANKHGSKRLYL